MKLFNVHPRQTFHYDYRDAAGNKTQIILLPQKSKEVPEEVATELLKKFPKHFTADTEAQDARANSKKALADRDQVIADLTKRCLEAEARAEKAEAALEVLAEGVEDSLDDPLGAVGLAEAAKETGTPAASAAEGKRKPKKAA